MVSAATLEELADYAARGRIGSAVNLRCSNLRPEADSEVLIEWESSVRGVLEIAGLRRIAVPPVGQRRIRVGAQETTVRLVAGERDGKLVIQPRVFVPSAELRVPEQLVIGAGSRITWQSDADTCRLRMTDGNDMTEHMGGAAGGLDIAPRCLGVLSIELEAIGRHAHLSPQLGISKLVKAIEVVAPPVVISLDTPEKSVPFGDEASFSWSVDGSREVRVEALDRRESYPVQRTGTLSVQASSHPERFRIVATGLDGIDKSAEFRLIPRLLQVADVPFNLDSLNLPWE